MLRMCPPGRESLARAPRVVLTSVACGSEARAPRERGWRSCAGRRPAHPGSAEGGRMRAGGPRTQGARMAVACGPEAGAPRERGWRSCAGRRLAHPGSADGGRVWAGGWRTQGARMAVACGPEARAPRERGWRSRAGRRLALLGNRSFFQRQLCKAEPQNTRFTP
jgi:hypothetical protein